MKFPRRGKKGEKGKKGKNGSEAPKVLGPGDLNEFRVRRAAVDQAVLASAMIQAGYGAWADELRARYGIVGKFDVNLATGEIVMREEGQP